MVDAWELTDEVVRAAVKGARKKLARILEAFEPRIRATVSARLGPSPAQSHAADEITQQVLEALAAGISRLEEQTVAGLRAFVSGIVTRKVSDLVKRGGNGKAGGPQTCSLDSTVTNLSGAGPLWQFIPVSGTSPPSAVERAELTRRLMLELGKLKPTYREVITLAIFDELPMRVVAERMRTTRPAASMLLIRAVQALRRSMDRPSEAE